jgi:hypothetical protein
MKKLLKYILPASIIGLLMAGMVYGASVFNSNQVGNSPSPGDVLQTNGTISTWVATSTLGISGGSGTPGGLSGQLQYNNGGVFTGLATGTPGTALFASSTSATGYEWKGVSGAGTVTSVDMSVPTGLAISGNPITAAGTLALTYSAGYAIPLTASTTAWNGFYNVPSTRITAGTNLAWSGNTLNGNMASSTIIAGGTATHSPSIMFASSSIDTTWNIVCGVSTCTFYHPNNLVTTTGYNNTNWDTAYGWGNHAGLYPTFAYGTSTYATILNYPTYTYGSSTYVNFGYATNTFATIANYPTYTYATSTFVARNLWTSIDNYPADCAAGNYVSGIGDTLTCTALPAGSGATTTIVSNITSNGPNFTFATSSVTGLNFNISGSGATITFAPQLQTGYVIPLTASTTEWTNKLSTTTAASTYPSFTYASSSYATLWNLKAGTNITISTTSGITISATGGSGNSAWTIGNGLIYNATSTDFVGIGTISPTSLLTLALDSSTTPAFTVLNPNGSSALEIRSGGQFSGGLLGNTLVGYQAGQKLAGGVAKSDGNSALGYQALANETTGRHNVAIGGKALYSMTSGADNIAIGQTTLGANQIGIDNIGIGIGTLLLATSNYNNALGSQAFITLSSGAYNNGFGAFTGYLSTTANNNNYFGHSSGYTNITGYNNVAMGNYSLYNNLSSNNIVLGNYVDVASSTLGQQLNIGNLIYGTGLKNNTNANDSTLATSTPVNGLVGIGSTTPTAVLTIQGFSGSTSPLLIVSSSTNASLFQVASNGSTTISSLVAGAVYSTSDGSLYNGAAGSGISSLNGLSGATQTFATNTTATGLTQTVTSAGTAHTWNLSLTSGYVIPSSTDYSTWMTASADRLKWDGGATGLVAATGRTSLGLGTMALEANTGSTTITTVGTLGSLNVTANVNMATLTASTLLMTDAEKNIKSYTASSNCSSGQVMYGFSAAGIPVCGTNGMQTAGTFFTTAATTSTGSIFNLTSSANTVTLTIPTTPTFTGITLTNSTTTGIAVIGTASTTSLSVGNKVVKGCFDKSFNLSSTTPDYLGLSFNTATYTIPSIWNPTYAVTLTKLYCKTDAGTVLLNFGANLLSCSATGASSTPSTNFAVEASVPVSLGTAATSPAHVTVTAGWCWQ